MKQKLQEYIETIKNKSTTNKAEYERFMKRLSVGGSLFKSEGALEHFNVFFVPVHKPSGSIYLGYHIKADDWIPPGGHGEPGEMPTDTIKREIKEELQHDITDEKVELFDVSYKFIGRPEKGCLGHYDSWHIVYMKDRYNFSYEKKEYHDAGWFTFDEGIKKITKNDSFAQVIRKIQKHITKK